jgi:hypothetical protein
MWKACVFGSLDLIARFRNALSRQRPPPMISGDGLRCLPKVATTGLFAKTHPRPNGPPAPLARPAPSRGNETGCHARPHEVFTEKAQKRAGARNKAEIGAAKTIQSGQKMGRVGRNSQNSSATRMKREETEVNS